MRQNSSSEKRQQKIKRNFALVKIDKNAKFLDWTETDRQADRQREPETDRDGQRDRVRESGCQRDRKRNLGFKPVQPTGTVGRN